MANIFVPGPFKVLTLPLTIGPPLEAGPAAAGPPKAGKDGLLAWWKLAETAGTCVSDSSDRGRQAAVNGVPRWLAGQGTECGALELDGAGNYLECPNAEEFDLQNRLTVSVWFKGRPGERSDKRVQSIFAKGEAWQLQRLPKHGSLSVLVGGLITPTNSPAAGAPPNLVSKRNLNDNQWHLAVATYDGRQATLYVDGREEASNPASGQLAVTTAPITLGDNAVSRGRFFDGWVSDARVYGRALNAQEVRALYEAGRKP